MNASYNTNRSGMNSAAVGSSVILDHGVVAPGRHVAEYLLSGSVDGPAPGLKERRQVHPHSLGEGLSIQVHLCIVLAGKVAHLLVGSKHLLKGIPAKPFLELHGRK